MGSKAAEAAAAGKTKERAKRVSAAVEQEEEGAAATPEELAAADFPRGKKRKQQQEQQQQQERKKKRQHLLDGGEEKQQQEGPESSGDSAAATRAAAAAAIDAAVAADPYLLEDAAYLRRDTRWLNKQRVLVLGSRGLTARTRLLLDDWKRLLPHHKAENKWEKKEKLQNITELCQLRSCNSVLYLEQRKNDALLHIAKVPLGPTFIARLMNVETLRELRLSGNCLLHSRPLLVFSPEFESQVQWRLLKELFLQVFGTPRNHPKSKPFFDHAMAFFVTDHRIWFRHYQIAPLVLGEGGDANNPHRQTYIEIGPRFVMDPVKILEGSFCGKTLWRNAEFVRTRDLLRPQRLQAALAFARRQGQKERRKMRVESLLEKQPTSKLATERIFGGGNVEVPNRKTSKTPKPKTLTA